MSFSSKLHFSSRGCWRSSFLPVLSGRVLHGRLPFAVLPCLMNSDVALPSAGGGWGPGPAGAALGGTRALQQSQTGDLRCRRVRWFLSPSGLETPRQTVARSPGPSDAACSRGGERRGRRLPPHWQRRRPSRLPRFFHFFSYSQKFLPVIGP